MNCYDFDDSAWLDIASAVENMRRKTGIKPDQIIASDDTMKRINPHLFEIIEASRHAENSFIANAWPFFLKGVRDDERYLDGLVHYKGLYVRACR